MIRPIGKITKLATFEKEINEGVFITPTREIPFKSCDVKKTMKTEEDTSNVGEVFTSDLITMGYDVAGSIDMNFYPETAGDILFFALGKSTKSTKTLVGGIFVNYTGNYEKVRLSFASSVFTSEYWDGTQWLSDNNFGTNGSYDVSGKTLAEIQTGINGFTGYRATGFGTGNDTDIEEFSDIVIKNNQDTTILFVKFSKTITNTNYHKIYASNSALDSIPAFSTLIDKGYGTGKCFGWSGCKINTLSLSFAVKTFITANISVKAKSETSGLTDNSSDFAMQTPYLTNNTRIFINNTEFTDIKDLKIDINNNMYVDEALGLDTYNTQDRQGATISISGTANLTIDTNDPSATQRIQEAYENNTPVSIILVLEGQNINSNAKYYSIIKLSKVKLSDGTTTIGGGERLTLSFSGQAVKNSLDNHIECYINNTKTTSY